MTLSVCLVTLSRCGFSLYVSLVGGAAGERKRVSRRNSQVESQRNPRTYPALRAGRAWSWRLEMDGGSVGLERWRSDALRMPCVLTN